MVFLLDMKCHDQSVKSLNSLRNQVYRSKDVLFRWGFSNGSKPCTSHLVCSIARLTIMAASAAVIISKFWAVYSESMPLI